MSSSLRANARPPGKVHETDVTPFKDVLHDLVMLRAEEDFLGRYPAMGQRPSWLDRWNAAWAEAEDLTRNEP